MKSALARRYAANQNLHRLVLESPPIGVCVVNREGKIILWSGGAERITGYLRQEVLGPLCEDEFLGHTNDENNALIGGSVPLIEPPREGRTLSAELSLRTKAGSPGCSAAPGSPRQIPGIFENACELFSRAHKEGLMALESDSDNPDQSPVFSKYPIFLKDHHVQNFVCDTIRMAAAGGIEPFDVHQMMELDMDVHHHEQTVPVSALSTMAIPCRPWNRRRRSRHGHHYGRSRRRSRPRSGGIAARCPTCTLKPLFLMH